MVTKHDEVHPVDLVELQDLALCQLGEVLDHVVLGGGALCEHAPPPGPEHPERREAEVSPQPEPLKDLGHVQLQRFRLDDHLRGHGGGAEVAGEPEGRPVGPDPGPGGV